MTEFKQIMGKETQEKNQIALEYGLVQTAIDELTETFGSRLTVSREARSDSSLVFLFP
jgi:hypothetical protein